MSSWEAHSQSNARLNLAEGQPRLFQSRIVADFFPEDTAKSQRLAHAVDWSINWWSRIVNWPNVVINAYERQRVFSSAGERHNHGYRYIDDTIPARARDRDRGIWHVKLRVQVSAYHPESTYMCVCVCGIMIYTMKTTARNERKKTRADVLSYSLYLRTAPFFQHRTREKQSAQAKDCAAPSTAI